MPPHTPRPAPIAVVRVERVEMLEVKKPMIWYTKIIQSGQNPEALSI